MLVFPVLRGEKIILRQLQVDDFDRLVQLASNLKISRRIVNIPHPYQIFNAVHRLSYAVDGFKNKTRFVFTIALQESNNLIGEISLHIKEDIKTAELGYWVGEPYWKKGYCSEAISKILEFGQVRLGLNTIFATVHPENIPSVSVLTKNGFSLHNHQANTYTYIIYF